MAQSYVYGDQLEVFMNSPKSSITTYVVAFTMVRLWLAYRCANLEWHHSQ